MASRRDVAEAAGVSVRTVSNVVAGFAHIAPATRTRVLDAIAQLEYRPSEVARTLRGGRSGLIGLMLPELDTPYFAELTRAFVEEGASRGLTVVIDQTDGDRARELGLLRRTARGSLFDALVLNPLALTTDDMALLTGDQHVVLLGENPYPGFDRVVIDNAAAAREATAHLIAGGRRRIAAIGAGRSAHGSGADRLAGYRHALRDAGLEEDPSLISSVRNFSRADGAEAVRGLLGLDSPPDAVFCFSDPLALGALRALHELGIRVPDDVAVVGFDDIEDGRFSVPTLTSISPDKRWIARTALDRIEGRLSGDIREPETLIGPHSLVIRESSRRPAEAILHPDLPLAPPAGHTGAVPQ